MSPYNMSTHNEGPPLSSENKYADIYTALETLAPGKWLKIADIDRDEIGRLRSALQPARTKGIRHNRPNTEISTRVERDTNGDLCSLWITVKPV